MINFLEKYLKLKISNDFLNVSQNDRTTKQFIGEVVKSIVVEQYEIIRKEASRLNIYTYEIRYNSKAYKIFMMEQFTFEFENRVQKELFIKFLANDNNSPLIAFTKEIKPLEFESYDDNYYAKCMFKKLETLNLDGELDVLYENIENLEERIDFLDGIGNESVKFYSDEDDLYEDEIENE